MIIVLSPAKSLDFKTPPAISAYSQPQFLDEAREINLALRKKSAVELQDLMGISDKLAQLNAERNFNWSPPFSPGNAKQALLAFNGDVYIGLNAATMSQQQLQQAQQKIRILSGLYGLLRPLDLIQPYRLEMGIKLAFLNYKNLYAYWSEKLTTALNDELKTNSGPLINLASQEYFKVIDLSRVTTPVISPVFKDAKNGKYKIISFYAKKARGLMSRFILENKIEKAEDIKAFDTEGYHFNNELSGNKEWIFTRG